MKSVTDGVTMRRRPFTFACQGKDFILRKQYFICRKADFIAKQKTDSRQFWLCITVLHKNSIPMRVYRGGDGNIFYIPG